MANLAGNVRIGQLGACIIRAARLGPDCVPVGGVNGGIVTAGLTTLADSPQVQDATVFEPKDACGNIQFTYERDEKILRRQLSGEFGLFDWELMELLFGGSVVLGKVGGDFAGEAIGYADPAYNAPPRNGVYLEIISTGVVEGAGDCVASDGSVPTAYGTIYGKAKLRWGDDNFADEVKLLTYTGTSTNNPNLFNGPWNDYPGQGYIPNTSKVVVGYSAAEYAAIENLIAPGYQTLPAGS